MFCRPDLIATIILKNILSPQDLIDLKVQSNLYTSKFGGHSLKLRPIESLTCKSSEFSKLGTNQIGGEIPEVNRGIIWFVFI